MEADTFSKIKAALARQQEKLRKIKFSVLVWAPGSEVFTKKRQQIIDSLTESGFTAFTSEELVKQVPSALPLPLQELQHWRAVDLVIVLEAGVAPGMELASYAHDAEFCQKCIVFHPRDWDPARQKTFPSEVLRLFPNRVPYAEREMKACPIVAACIHRAEALRRYHLLNQSLEIM